VAATGRRLNRKLVGLGVCAVVVVAGVGAGVSFALGGGEKAVTLPTTGAYVPITVAKPATGLMALAQGVDPDSMSKVGSDLETVLSAGSQAHHYKLTIQNTSGMGYVNSLYWSPPSGVTVTKVTGSSVGNCTLTGTSGFGGKLFPGVVLYPKIACAGLNLKPPSCTCKADGGRIVISFVADQFPGLAGSVGITSATPVLKIIPSFVQSPDVPKCAKGQSSTTTKPCSPGSG
jgi:hypothetical protein